MKIRNKKTGEIREVPDGTIPDVEDKKESPVSAIPGFLKGVIKKGSETTTVPLMRLLGNMGVPGVGREVEKWNQERQTEPMPGQKLGEVATDFAMLAAPTPFGKAGAVGKVIAPAMQGVAAHQAQEYGKTGEMNPKDAATEAAIATALPVVGGKAADAASGTIKTGAAGLLQLLTRAPKRLERGMNPPTLSGFKQALEERIFPIVKGGYKTAEKRGIAKQVERDAEKIALMDQAGIRFNAPGAIKEAEGEIMSRAGGRRGLLPSQMGSGVKQLEQYSQAIEHPSYGMNRGGFMAPKQAIDLRKMADENANWVQGKTPEGLDLASQEFRTAAEKQLGRRMQGKAGEARYNQLKQEMADLAPVLEAFNEKAISNYSIGPELATGLIGSLGGNPWIGAIPAIRRAPQIAPAFYELGRGVGSEGAKYLGRQGLNLGRSATYGGN